MKSCLLHPCVIFTSSQTEELEPKFVLRVDCHWPSKEAASPTGGGRENRSETGDSSLPIAPYTRFFPSRGFASSCVHSPKKRRSRPVVAFLDAEHCSFFQKWRAEGGGHACCASDSRIGLTISPPLCVTLPTTQRNPKAIIFPNYVSLSIRSSP